MKCPITSIDCSCSSGCEEQQRLDAQRYTRLRKERVLWMALVDAELRQSIEAQRALRARMGGPLLMEGCEDDLLIAMNAGNEIRRRLVQEIGLDLDELGYDAKDLFDDVLAKKTAERCKELEDREKMIAVVDHGKALLAKVEQDSTPPRCFACGHEICACPDVK